VALPLLDYAPSSQNQRVNGFEVPGDEQPRFFSTDNLPDSTEVEDLIEAAYRQIFNEQQLLKSNRLPWLESQLKSGQITVKDFIRSLLTAPSFRDRNYGTNNNYRFARMCVQRVLGREVYNDQEVLAWSIVLATKGLNGFVDALVNSEEYQTAFGDNTVPYQRRRILPQHGSGMSPLPIPLAMAKIISTSSRNWATISSARACPSPIAGLGKSPPIPPQSARWARSSPWAVRSSLARSPPGWCCPGLACSACRFQVCSCPVAALAG
jgi:phycobilisome rod-core linker protein